MNKIRVIDLLNKIAKGEEVPKKIKCGNIIYIYDDFEKDYVDEFEEDVLKRKIRTTNDILDIYYLFRKTSSGRYVNMSKHLNYEVEVIEGEIEIIEEDKPIEKIKIENDSPTHFYIKNEFGTKCGLTRHSRIIAEKVNEIIDKVNKLEEGKK